LSIGHRQATVDILDAFRRAILVTQATVEPGTATEAELAKMLNLTTKMLDEAEADEAATRLLESILGRQRQVGSRG